MIDYDKIFRQAIDTVKSEGRYRNFTTLTRIAGQFPTAITTEQQEKITIWCSNDYLGMGQRPQVIEAMRAAASKMGVGSGGTRNISGTNDEVVRLEESIADLHQKPKALAFVCGYMANYSTLSALAAVMPEMAIFSDEYNHASIIEGIKIGRRDKFIFRHNDPKHLEQLLQQVDINRPKIIVFESVYSMDGDISPVKEICDLAEKYQAITMIDEVHSAGIYGPRGGGISEQMQVAGKITIIQGTLAKAFGAMGGYIASSEVIIDVVRSYSSSFIFTTSLPPSLAAAARSSIEHLKTSQTERTQQKKVVVQVKSALMDAAIPIKPTSTHIIPVIIGDPVICRRISEDLLEHHKIFIQYINYPTVPRGTERLRITPTPLHTEQMIAALKDSLVSALEKFKLEIAAI